MAARANLRWAGSTATLREGKTYQLHLVVSDCGELLNIPDTVAAPPAPAAPASAPTSNLPACVNSDCNCSDFSSWQQAQDVLNAYPGDPHRLDRDSDGIACDSLR